MYYVFFTKTKLGNAISFITNITNIGLKEWTIIDIKLYESEKSVFVNN